MTRILPCPAQDLDTNTAATLEAVGKKLGILPNLFTTLAHAPAALNSYLGFSESVKHGQLNAQQREIVSLAVAQYNQCQYCLSAHSLLAKGTGLSDREVYQARNGGDGDTINHTIAAFAREVTAARGVLADDIFDAYSARGLSHALMIEIVANVALNLFSNYINHLADTAIDFPVVDLDLDAAA